MQNLTPTVEVLITADPDLMSGTPVFRGTRVPVQTLFDYLAEGYTLAEFLANFPTVDEDTAVFLLTALVP